MNKYPEIQQILSGNCVYQKGIVNEKISFFSKLVTEREHNILKRETSIQKKITKEKIMLFDKITDAKEKTNPHLHVISPNENTKSHRSFNLIR